MCRSPRVEARRADRAATSASFPTARRHLRQLGRRDGHAEQAHRQHDDRRRVAERRHHAERKKRREPVVDVAADLHDAAADEHRSEVLERPRERAASRVPRIEIADARPSRSVVGSCTRNCSAAPTTDAHASVDGEIALAPAADPRPAARRSSRRSRAPARDTTGETCRWLFRMPRHHAEITNMPAPGNRIRVRRIVSSRVSPSKPWRDQRNEHRRRDDADEHEHRHDERQHRADRAGDATRLLVVACSTQLRVHGNERRRQRAFAEQVLQEVRDLERRRERVGRHRSRRDTSRSASVERCRRVATRGCRARRCAAPPVCAAGCRLDSGGGGVSPATAVTPTRRVCGGDGNDGAPATSDRACARAVAQHRVEQALGRIARETECTPACAPAARRAERARRAPCASRRITSTSRRFTPASKRRSRRSSRCSIAASAPSSTASGTRPSLARRSAIDVSLISARSDRQRPRRVRRQMLARNAAVGACGSARSSTVSAELVEDRAARAARRSSPTTAARRAASARRARRPRR